MRTLALIVLLSDTLHFGPRLTARSSLLAGPEKVVLSPRRAGGPSAEEWEQVPGPSRSVGLQIQVYASVSSPGRGSGRGGWPGGEAGPGGSPGSRTQAEQEPPPIRSPAASGTPPHMGSTPKSFTPGAPLNLGGETEAPRSEFNIRAWPKIVEKIMIIL